MGGGPGDRKKNNDSAGIMRFRARRGVVLAARAHPTLGASSLAGTERRPPAEHSRRIVARALFFKQKPACEISTRDWSSDVCSSDLWPGCEGCPPCASKRLTLPVAWRCTKRRSEERRVGKEGRSRWSPYH